MESGATPVLRYFRRQRLHMPLNAVARFDELLVTGGETRAAKALAVLAESRAGNDGHFLCLQQTDGEIFLVHARLTDVRERVERATRQVTLQADFVEAAHDEITAAMILDRKSVVQGKRVELGGRRHT